MTGGRINVKHRLTPGATITDASGWANIPHNPTHLRITRKGATITCAYRGPAPTDEWTTYYTHHDTAGHFGNNLIFGIGVTSPNPPADTTSLQSVTFSEIDFRKLDGGTVLILK